MKGDWRWVGETRHGDYVVGWKGERLITFQQCSVDGSGRTGEAQGGWAGRGCHLHSKHFSARSGRNSGSG